MIKNTGQVDLNSFCQIFVFRMNSLFFNLLDVTKNVGAEIIDNITPDDYNLRDLEKKYTIKDISDDEEWVFLCLEQLNNVGRIGNGRHSILQEMIRVYIRSY